MNMRRIVIGLGYLLLIACVFMLPNPPAEAQTPWAPSSGPAQGPFRYFRLDGQCYAFKPYKGPTQPMLLMAVTCTPEIRKKLGSVPSFE